MKEAADMRLLMLTKLNELGGSTDGGTLHVALNATGAKEAEELRLVLRSAVEDGYLRLNHGSYTLLPRGRKALNASKAKGDDEGVTAPLPPAPTPGNATETTAEERAVAEVVAALRAIEAALPGNPNPPASLSAAAIADRAVTLLEGGAGLARDLELTRQEYAASQRLLREQSDESARVLATLEASKTIARESAAVTTERDELRAALRAVEVAILPFVTGVVDKSPSDRAEAIIAAAKKTADSCDEYMNGIRAAKRRMDDKDKLNTTLNGEVLDLRNKVVDLETRLTVADDMVVKYREQANTGRSAPADLVDGWKKVSADGAPEIWVLYGAAEIARFKQITRYKNRWSVRAGKCQGFAPSPEVAKQTAAAWLSLPAETDDGAVPSGGGE